jgi:hypothetical protein
MGRETSMNPFWGEAQRRTGADTFFASEAGREEPDIRPVGKKGGGEGFIRRSASHRSSSQEQGIVAYAHTRPTDRRIGGCRNRYRGGAVIIRPIRTDISSDRVNGTEHRAGFRVIAQGVAIGAALIRRGENFRQHDARLWREHLSSAAQVPRSTSVALPATIPCVRSDRKLERQRDRHSYFRADNRGVASRRNRAPTPLAVDCAMSFLFCACGVIYMSRVPILGRAY